MPTITLDATKLRHALAFVSKEASRPILNTVCIEPSGIIIATDGHTLLAVKNGAEWGEDDKPTDNMLLRFEKAPPVKADKLRVTLPDVIAYGSRVRESAGIMVEYLTNYNAVFGAGVCYSVEGPYPQWRKVVPRTVEPDLPAPAVNAELVKRFAIVDESRGIHKVPAVTLVRSSASPNSALHVNMHHADYCGVLMPLHFDYFKAAFQRPAFIDLPPVDASAVAA